MSRSSLAQDPREVIPQSVTELQILRRDARKERNNFTEILLEEVKSLFP